MLSKNQIKYINSLKLKKFRELHRQFIAEGTKLVFEFTDSSYTIEQLFIQKDWLEDPLHAARLEHIPFQCIDRSEMQRITALSSPSPALAIIKMPDETQFVPPKSTGLYLVLDQIQDPGNLGTIIRIADWFGISEVICSPDTVDLFNPKVVQATMGSLVRVPVSYRDLSSFMKQLPEELPVYGTCIRGNNLYAETLPKHAILVFGSEAHGISSEIASFITQWITIPLYQEGKGNFAESLNVSVAVGVVCAEFKRRNHEPVSRNEHQTL